MKTPSLRSYLRSCSTKAQGLSNKGNPHREETSTVGATSALLSTTLNSL